MPNNTYVFAVVGVACEVYQQWREGMYREVVLVSC